MASRRARGLLVLCLAGGVLAGSAHAAAGLVTVMDKDDARGRLDVARVTLARAPDGRLVAAVTTRGPWTISDLRSRSGPPGSICVRLWIHRDAAAEQPDYLVCATAPSTGDDLAGAIMHDRANGLPRKVAVASAVQTDDRTIVLRFGQSTIGRPGSLRFGVETVSYRSGCPRPAGCRDTAPNAPSSAAFTVPSG